MVTKPDICVILNAGSGKRDAVDSPRLIRNAFSSHKKPYVLKQIRKGSDLVDAAESAVEEGYKTVVAAGGDGTICAVASAVCKSQAQLGIIPLGTFNYFARSLGIPDDVDAAVDVMLNGSHRTVPVALINDRVFLNNASLGAYPAILRNRENVYKRWGRSRVAAYWSVLKTLLTLRKPLMLQLSIGQDSFSYRTPLVFAVNNAFQLDQIGLEGRDDIADGRMVLFVAPDSGRWGMLKHAIALATGTAEKNRDFLVHAADEVRISTGRRARNVACDGERARMPEPMTLKVNREGLNVMVPRARADGVR
ncbi:diacylglycerol/lipid kinase family protein [Qingshengfaniella alkalisoli]|uniref:Diacylglycerol O-acyltransferase n=1 Tax=Qingshengfaniella alkalisoli TaxID=2599296 RepID=A0A5B8J1F7_9RHOB|nr:diacylglycerol kinase family protein [Qingshengfaniella alkalisoli]QDY71613.1 diacylglycerol O-acyltransferase [Qingshengfaniella alkalisoli]